MNTIKSLSELQPGDRVEHIRDKSLTFMVSANCGTYVTAVSTMDISNPSEWCIIAKANMTAVPRDSVQVNERLLKAIQNFDRNVETAQGIYNELHPTHVPTVAKLQRKPKIQRKARKVFKTWKCPACGAMVLGSPTEGPCPKCGDE